MELTLEQAIKIRNDFNHLEGRNFELGGLDLTINKVIVGPYYSKKLNDFLEAYHKNDFEYRDDEEGLAKSFNPSSYCVYILYYDLQSISLYENIFSMGEKLDMYIDLEKYGLKSEDS
jgi:hypothetical protein